MSKFLVKCYHRVWQRYKNSNSVEIVKKYSSQLHKRRSISIWKRNERKVKSELWQPIVVKIKYMGIRHYLHIKDLTRTNRKIRDVIHSRAKHTRRAYKYIAGPVISPECLWQKIHLHIRGIFSVPWQCQQIVISVLSTSRGSSGGS